MPHIRVRPTALIVKDNSILLVEYDDHGIHYNLPGGGAEPGETLIEGVIREAYEEMNADIEVGPLALIYEFAPHKQSGDYDPYGTHGLHLIFDCKIKDGSIPRLPDNPDLHQVAVKWIHIDELDSIVLIPNIKEQIRTYIKNKKALELIEDHRLQPLK